MLTSANSDVLFQLINYAKEYLIECKVSSQLLMLKRKKFMEKCMQKGPAQTGHYSPNWFNCLIVCLFWAKSGKYYSEKREKLMYSLSPGVWQSFVTIRSCNHLIRIISTFVDNTKKSEIS